MRRIICLLVALLVCVGLTMSAMAVENDFVPSVTYKDGPEVRSAVMDGEDVSDCIVVTTLEQGEDKSTDITDEDRDLLKEVYEDLRDGTATLPMEEDYVIRDLVDVSFKFAGCRNNEDHADKEAKLEEEGVTLMLTFALGIRAHEEIAVFAFIDGQWVRIENVKNNGDGTLTCEFEKLCPVAFVVESKEGSDVPTTGDIAGGTLAGAIAIMCLSAMGIVALVAPKFRRFM